MRIKYGGTSGCECWAYIVAWLLTASVQFGHGGLLHVVMSDLHCTDKEEVCVRIRARSS